MLYVLTAFALSGTVAKFIDFVVLPAFVVPVIFFIVAFALRVLVFHPGG